MNSSSHFVSLSTIFAQTIILTFSDTASLSSVTICFTTMAIFIVTLLDEMGACTDRPALADAAARVAARFPHKRDGPINPTINVKVKVRVTLRLAVYHQLIRVAPSPLRLTTKVFSTENLRS
jgi:hypothetical protein